MQAVFHSTIVTSLPILRTPVAASKDTFSLHTTEVYRCNEFEPAARALSMQLRIVNVESLEDFVAAIAELTRNRAVALVVSSSPLSLCREPNFLSGE